LRWCVFSAVIFLQIQCSPPKDFMVLHQTTGSLGTNCYLLYDAASRESALIDVGGPVDSLVSTIAREHLKLKYVFATHGHRDHVEGVPAVKDKFPDALVCLTPDPPLICKPDVTLGGNQIYRLGGLEIRTILSPGHTPGSVCFQVGDVLFSGDVLFHRSVGRTDLPGGSTEEIVKSVRRLYSLLPDETTVYPGHGPFTNIGSEKKYNECVTADKVYMK
jgi:hydroxyacylglutathione hydrolase